MEGHDAGNRSLGLSWLELYRSRRLEIAVEEVHGARNLDERDKSTNLEGLMGYCC